MKRFFAVSAVLGLLAFAGCSRDSGGDSKETIEEPIPNWKNWNKPIALTSSIKSFESCESAKNYVADFLSKKAEQYIKDQAYWHYNCRNGIMCAESSKSTMENGATIKPEAAVTHTGTNNQVSGIEEGDFVKNDGKHIFMAHDKRVEIVKMWPAAELNSVSNIEINGDVNKLLLLSDADGIAKHLVVLYSLPVYYNTGIAIYNVADATRPTLLSNKEYNANLMDVRQIGTKILTTLSSSVDFPSGVVTYINDVNNLSDSAFEKKMAEVIAKNNAIIQSTSLQDLLNTNTELASIVDYNTCGNIKYPSGSTYLNKTFIISTDALSSEQHGELLLSDVNTMYANEKNIILASRHWWWNAENQPNATYLHQFSLENGYPKYTASGVVDGDILNQFSLDEEDSYIRVATTVTKLVEDKTPKADPFRLIRETENRISILQPDNNALKIVGEIKNIANGESIQAVRFFGKRGFLVTFKQIDPFFTLDLSVPTAPRIVGELKIPGYSTYLHPVGENYILAAGVQPSVNGSWWSALPKVSLYDISDFANPKEKFSVPVGLDLSHAYSETNWDHKAFTYFANNKLLAIPVSGYNNTCDRYTNWNSSCYLSQLDVFRIDENTGIKKVMSMSMNDVSKQVNYGWGYWSQNAYISRSIFAVGDVNGTMQEVVYGISNMGIRAAILSEASDTNRPTVVFP